MDDLCPECQFTLSSVVTPTAIIWWCDGYECPGFEQYFMEEFA